MLKSLRPFMAMILLAAWSFMALAQESEEKEALPIKGGEKILFIGNSLTGQLPSELNTVLKANGLPEFEGYRLQIWNQTFETHWTISRETHGDLFYDKPNKDGFAVKGQTTLWKKGLYNDPKYVERGFIYAKEAIELGTPEGKPWDIVVLQGYAAGAPENKKTVSPDGKVIYEGPFLQYGALLIDTVRKAGAQPVLYENWLLNPAKGGGNEDPDSYYNNRFDNLLKNYKILGEDYDVPIIPIGAAMRALSLEDKPEDVPTEWLIRDNVHGTAMGKALMLYSFAAALTGKPATELQYEFKSTTKWNKSSHYVIGEPDARYNVVITEAIDNQIKKVVDKYIKQYEEAGLL
ncbi:MAG: hypothetical protein ACOC2L_03940 [Candidatus Sumerlaeota bacterium]